MRFLFPLGLLRYASIHISFRHRLATLCVSDGNVLWVGGVDELVAKSQDGCQSGRSFALRSNLRCCQLSCRLSGRCLPRGYPSLSKGDSRALKLRYLAKFC